MTHNAVLSGVTLDFFAGGQLYSLGDPGLLLLRLLLLLMYAIIVDTLLIFTFSTDFSVAKSG